MTGQRASRTFLILWSFYTAALGLAVLGTGQLELHRAMHPFHSSTLDQFFTHITHLGDGVVPTVLALVILLLRDVRSFLMMGISCAASALIVQAMKHAFAYDRPFMFKQQLGELHWVDGLELHHHLSFPSGHATASFSMCYALAVLIGRNGIAAALAVLAIVIAYSRVYLSQHFSEDILAGSAIGVITALLVHRWLYGPAMMTRRWPGKRLLGQLNQ
ncbi:MAG: phosphatase PAP2 family protein [Flavobacteriales bacterium]|nr:phosphatase PAP2 family protein [Flavobacteriales bacterium]